MRGPTDPAWLAATYRLRLPVARALIRDHLARQCRRFWLLAFVAGTLWLVDITAAFRLLAMPGMLRGLLLPCALLALGFHVWLVQRAARGAILAEAARLTQDPVARKGE
ncbi:hypothetical protein ATSB10_29500 [Dyella thiooxydans]|uniref:Uncharacterized protein n=1 Tax=Dyella thiooxydans TaxID=445710 RepID=A0A160N3Z0_9GAMM|nr:hypothetical protein [Dyella thiooxydans]AND70404.1 hypothetical protein ATSB10_29500 [Dyella thiooxydans]